MAAEIVAALAHRADHAPFWCLVGPVRSEEHTSELQSLRQLVCRLLLEKKKASSDNNSEPDVVMACAGDIPTLETLAAVDLLRKHFPDLKIRVINVVDLMTIQPSSEHPHGLSDNDFDSLFTVDKPVIFAYHGYPWLIHRLTYRRHNHDNLHVRGYKEAGTTTTPFDLTEPNELHRF